MSKLSATIDPDAWAVILGAAGALYGLYEVSSVVVKWLTHRELPPKALRKAASGCVVAVLGGALALGLLDPYLVQPEPEEGEADPTRLIGLLSVVAGLYLLGSLYPEWARARRTACAITDRRIIVREGDRIVSLEPASLGRVEVRERRGGSGDLLFHGVRVTLSSIPDVRLAAERVKELVEAPPPEEARPEAVRREYRFFYAVEPRKTAGDRFYNVYVAGGALCAAQIGGSIHNIALNPAFLAAQASTKATMPLILSAVRTEFRKLERPVREADFL